ncbi:acetyl-CoA carboxylase biotin carboxyl carrier protein [Novosphingobium colocasiae]|uniref:Biotin carboxyl carrier protein of acetyl-CoA carboxylase n=1 Tax=Novosphingobium colocasiae TaxID=1256513 RepID=A0A918PCX6_9SPHN|nr:acetyl-CoA carboxylase biotin carboxyl carrier protein [Novosphingobium colocasiae]GGY98889.1 acetyl-CoA carboxylase biotin carboxyl carrier protein subunit [Novosphingobium colocasiae]
MSGPDTLRDIETLIAEFQASGLRELHVRSGGVEIYLSNDARAAGLDAAPVVRQAAAVAAPSATPAASAAAPAAAAPAAVAGLPDNVVIVRAPYLGTFYRSPKPGSPVYVDVGTVVTPESDMCLVEVMKLFTAVRAGISGTVHAILATDGQMVEADQPLFAVIPG